MTDQNGLPNAHMPFRLSRRQIISGMAALGAVAGGRTALCAGAEAHHRARGRIHAAADRDPEFRRRHAGRCRGRRRRVAGHHQQSEAQWLVRADRSGRLHRAHQQYRRRAAVPELEDHQRAGAGDRPHDPAGRRPPQGRVSALGRQHRPAAHRPAIFHLAGILAPDRAHHLRPDLRAADRRKRLFRQPRGVRRRDRAEGAPGQAAGDDGPGRRQCPLSDQGTRTWC